MGICICILLSISLASGERACAFPSNVHSKVWAESLVVELVSDTGWHGFLPGKHAEGHLHMLGWLGTTCTNSFIGSTHVQPMCHAFRHSEAASWDPNLCFSLITPDGVQQFWLCLSLFQLQVPVWKER